MARKKIMPKKLGPVRIPKNLRRMGNKALADPQVVEIVTSALVSIGAAVAAAKIAQKVPGGATLARSVSGGETLGSVAEVVKQAFADIVRARHQTPEDEPRSGKGSRPKTKPDVGKISSSQTH